MSSATGMTTKIILKLVIPLPAPLMFSNPGQQLRRLQCINNALQRLFWPYYTSSKINCLMQESAHSLSE